MESPKIKKTSSIIAFFENFSKSHAKKSHSLTTKKEKEKPKRRLSLFGSKKKQEEPIVTEQNQDTISDITETKSETKENGKGNGTLYSRMESSGLLSNSQNTTSNSTQSVPSITPEPEKKEPAEFYLVEDLKKPAPNEFYLLDEKQQNLYVLSDEQRLTTIIDKVADDLSIKLEQTQYDSGIKDWTSILTKTLKLIKSGANPDFNSLADLSNQFADTATLYAKIIVSELGLPDDLKTIKRSNIGGVAGGQKYVYHNILFKVALDSIVVEQPRFWMYGGASGPSDLHAIKTAKNELKGIEAFASAHVPSLSFPMTCMIDYKGYRVIASSLLPIGKDSLKYGSSDAGRTVHTDLDEINESMKEVAKRLNLKGHITGQGTGKKLIYGPGDCEVHLGRDGNAYALDFGRLLPPEDPRIRNESNKRAVFYNLLRIELVKTNPVPLCSDAFTNWNSDDDIQSVILNNQEVADATNKLYNQIIPGFAAALDQQDPTIDWDKIYGVGTPKREVKRLVTSILGRGAVHSHGINFRQLGVLRTKVKSERMKRLILSICVARYIKDDLRSRMRETMKTVRVPSDEPFKGVVTKLFNTILGHDIKASLTFWEDELKQGLQDKYVECLTPEELQSEFDLKTKLDLRVVFIYLLNLVGVGLKPIASHDLFKNPAGFRFVETDIKSLESKTTPFHFLYFTEAMALFTEAQQSISVSAANYEAQRLLQVSIQKLQAAHESCPICAKILTGLGNVTKTLASVIPDPVEKEVTMAKAEQYLAKATTYFNYGAAMDTYASCLREHAAFIPDAERKMSLLSQAQAIEEKHKNTQVLEYA